MIDCLAKSTFPVSQSVAKFGLFSKHGMLKLFYTLPFCTEMKANSTIDYRDLWNAGLPKSLAPSNTTELFSLKTYMPPKVDITEQTTGNEDCSSVSQVEISQWEEDRVPSVVY